MNKSIYLNSKPLERIGKQNFKKGKRYLQNSCESPRTMVKYLGIKNNDLQNKYDDSHRSLLKLTKRYENLDKLLGS